MEPEEKSATHKHIVAKDLRKGNSKSKQPKKCFLITPIGSINSPERSRVDQWMDLIYKPALNGKYTLIRSDLLSVPGKITSQIIDLVIEAELVIIDLTPNEGERMPNSNVMYEAAIRHIAQKPVIQIIPENNQIPFDIKDFRCISYNPRNLLYPKILTKSLKSAIKDIDLPGYKTPDIIGHTFDLEKIVSDPVKFVDLLKEKIFANNPSLFRVEPNNYSSGTSVNNNADINWSWLGQLNNSGTSMEQSHFVSLGSSMQPICPYCGSSKTQPIMRSYLSLSSNEYKCDSCRRSFFA